MKAVGKLIDEGFNNASVVNPKGQQFKLGSQAFFIWKNLRELKKKKSIVLGYCEKFKVTDDVAEGEYEKLVDHLTKIGLIQ